MGYAADHDDIEQAAQGAEACRDTSFEDFIHELTGRNYGELSNSERANADWQWRNRRKLRA